MPSRSRMPQQSVVGELALQSGPGGLTGRRGHAGAVISLILTLVGEQRPRDETPGRTLRDPKRAATSGRSRLFYARTTGDSQWRGAEDAAWAWVVGRDHLSTRHRPRRAASIAAISIFFIPIIASNARLAAAGSRSESAAIRARGVICQDTPHLSLHH